MRGLTRKSMTNLRVQLALIVVCVIAGQSILAQVKRNSNLYRNIPAFGVVKLSFGGGMSYYLGDMRAKTNLRFIEPHLAVALNYRLTERFSIRGEADLYRISGKQAGGPIWYNNLSFRSDNPAGYLAIQVDAFKYSDENTLKPYIFGGIGVTHINPKAKLENKWYNLQPLMTEGVDYNQNPRISIVGIGMSWKYNDRWGFAIELSNNYANSDYLDDVSTVYPEPTGLSELALKLSDRRPELDPASLPAGYAPNNVAGNQRGNPKVKDAYGFLSLRAEYLIGTQARRAERRKLKCYY
jgi:hypothetical protein